MTEKKIKNVKVKVNLDQDTPKFTNQTAINVSPEDVILSFLWVERDVDKNAEEIPGKIQSRIIMSARQAKSFSRALNEAMKAIEPKKKLKDKNE